VDVRVADTSDLPAIAAIGVDAWSYAYRGLVGPTSVKQYLETAYSSEGLTHRIDEHPVYLVVNGREVMSFADLFIQDERVVVAELCTVPRWRRHGCATALVETARAFGGGLPVAADVVVGNVGAEEFYAHCGFTGGPAYDRNFFGEKVAERTWLTDQ
jgi:GNAT superfamily N-acetyltransferase